MYSGAFAARAVAFEGGEAEGGMGWARRKSVRLLLANPHI